MDSDYEYALKLQRQLLEEEIESPEQISKPKSNSLVDPDWELSDPNPDIYQLFQLFNHRFFWNKLGAVEVKWSPRMTSCAGICTYKGVRGCIVSLSLPLLKFRPRKDLIETLLHEMIHAYLFVTHNNKDRDGHGPEFHKHMYRINAAAGTNITVYHTFHDEVRHHKTHVWRCDGICRQKAPFFGIVRRSMNRAPGPNDFWYKEHRFSCGGTFHKVSEPEGFQSKKKMKTPEEPKKTNGEKLGGLTKFFPTTPGNSLNNTKTPLYKKPVPVPPFKIPTPPKQSTLQNFGIMSQGSPRPSIPPSKPFTASNISGFGHALGGGTIVKHGGVRNNIHGFTNLSRPSGSAGPSGYRSGGGTAMSNRGGTILEKPKKKLGSGSAKNFDLISPNKLTIPGPVFPGVGHTLSGGTNDRYKSRLLNLIPPPAPKELESDGRSDSAEEVPDQRPDSGNRNLKCPVCNIPIDPVKINEHLDECAGLDEIMNSSSETILIPDSDDECETSEEGAATVQSLSKVKCPNCDYTGPEQTINEHLDDCLSLD